MSIRSSIVLLTACATLLSSAGLGARPTLTTSADDVPPPIDAGGGRVIRFPEFDLRGPGAKWNFTGPLRYTHRTDARGVSFYEFSCTNPELPRVTNSSSGTFESIPVVPNRTYRISAAIQTDFARPGEVNFGLRMVNSSGVLIVSNLNGLPNKTNGWQRWEWEITADPRATHAILGCRLYSFPAAGVLRFADIAVVELPPKPLPVYAPGEGATFRGGPGKLPMRVEGVETRADAIVVMVTGARYTFSTGDDTITMEQRIDAVRTLTRWKSSVALAGLRVRSENAKECVLANDNITFGVQCDSLVMAVPHRPVILTCTSAISGRWNRLGMGHLLAVDELGGFAVHPDIPFGTGRLPRVHVGAHWAGTFQSSKAPGRVDFADTMGNVQHVTRAKPGWSVQWHLERGERLAFSVAPPRAYPWKESFTQIFGSLRRAQPLAAIERMRRYVDALVLWDFTQRGWSFSWGREHVPYDDQQLRATVVAVKAAGIVPVLYGSSQWYYSRDAQEYADELRRMRDTYGIGGVYLDGIPSQEWIVAYEEMRLLREVFPDGRIIVHSTGNSYNGGPPLGEPAFKCPAIETYADATLAAEGVFVEGLDAPYMRYITPQFRLANTIGVTKPDAWVGGTREQRDFTLLHNNGRLRFTGDTGYFDRTYLPVLNALRKVWEEKGHLPRFYEDHFRPAAMALTKRHFDPSDVQKTHEGSRANQRVPAEPTTEP